MNEQHETPNTNEVTSYEEAEKIVKLRDITVNNPLEHSKRQHPTFPLFNSKQAINTDSLWWLLLKKHGVLDKNKLQQIHTLLDDQTIRADIHRVHDQILGTTVNPTNGWFTSAMMFPLLENLLTTPPKSSQEEFNRWRDDWMLGVDPSKFRMAISLQFQLLSQWPLENQREWIANLGDKPVNPDEAEMLAGIFEKMYGQNYDVDEIRAADRRNRALVEASANRNTTFTPQDLFHTTDLTTLPLVIDKGLLATECTSLTTDWMREANFAVSFFSFKQAPNSLTELGEGLKKGGHETYRQHPQRIHLAFLNPQAFTDPEYILYPPHSYWPYRHNRTTIAGRYIGGYDGYDSEFPNKAPSYVLIGMPSTALSFTVLDEMLQQDYAAVAKDSPFYLPAYSYEGKLLYTPEEYDAAKTA